MLNSNQLFSRDIERHYATTTKTEETYLFRLYKETGNRKAYNKIYNSAIKFVISVAHRYKNQGVELEDLIGAGNIFLHRAITDFKPNPDNKFLSYAVWWIRHGILDEIANQSRNVRITVAESNKKHQVNKATEKLAHELGRIPTLKELSKETKLTIKELNILMQIDNFSHLDAKMGDEGNTLMDTLADHNELHSDAILNEKTRENILNFIQGANLNRHKDGEKIIKMYYGIGEPVNYTLDEIGERIGKTRERVRQIRNDCINTLKKHNKTQKREHNLHLTKSMLD